jgi:hypothetical protein
MIFQGHDNLATPEEGGTEELVEEAGSERDGRASLGGASGGGDADLGS